MTMPMFCRAGRAIVAGALFAMAYPMSVVAQIIINPNLFQSVLDSAGFTAVWTAPGSTGEQRGNTGVNYLEAIASATNHCSHPSHPTCFLRYPIQPIHNDDLVHACLKLGAMYRDNSAETRVIVRLKSVDLTVLNFQPQTVMTIDSDAYPASNSFQVRDVTINSWFNFNRNVYYVEVELTKENSGSAEVRWIYLAAPLSSSLCPS